MHKIITSLLLLAMLCGLSAPVLAEQVTPASAVSETVAAPATEVAPVETPVAAGPHPCPTRATPPG